MSISPLQTALRAYCLAFTALGVLAPLPLLVLGHRPSGSQLVLAGLLAAVGLGSDWLRIEFTLAGEEIDVSPDIVVWVLAAVFLPTPLAMTVALASVVTGMRGIGLRRALLTCGALSGAVGVTSWLVEQLVAGTPAGTTVLGVGLLAAAVFEFVYVTEGLAYIESRERGSARTHLQSSLVIAGFEVFLPTIAIGLVAPFVALPVWAAIVLASFQVVTYLGLRVMKSEQQHRRTSAFLKDTFSRYLPASVVEQLSDEQASVTLGGQEREISVMFVDIRNFTSWSEHLAPTQIIAQLNELMTELTQAIFDTDGTLDKFTGDGLMAFWGAPLDQPDHAARACRAALSMVERVKAFNAGREGDEVELYVGVGIHSGRAVVGNVGHVDRLDYTAIGDTVNVAARLEAATKDAGCSALISADTKRLLTEPPAGAPLEPLGSIAVKGRTEPVETFVLAYGLQPGARQAPAAA